MRVSGPLLDVERKAGAFTDDDGKDVKYDFIVLHVLEGREVVKVRLPKAVDVESLQLGQGELVEFDVTVPSGTKVRFVKMTELEPAELEPAL